MAGRMLVVPMQIGGVELLVEAAAPSGSEETSRLGRAQAAVADAFDRAQDAIVAVAGSTVATIGRLGRQSARPAVVSVKFGVKFSAQGNVIIAGGSGEATLEVTLTYQDTAQPGTSADGG